jgi:hypothetical protein
MLPINSDLSEILASAPAYLPLTQAELPPKPEKCRIHAGTLFPNSPTELHRDAATAGLLFRLGCWDESHAAAQDIETPEGSFWHGMLHRVKPDSANAKYWFRRVGQHAVFPQLRDAAGEILKAGGPPEWRLKAEWDPFSFVDWCEQARERRGLFETCAVAIQMAEWQLLFDWCAGQA